VSALLGLLPPLLLALALALGFYPGERLIARLAPRPRQPRRNASPAPPRPPRAAGAHPRLRLLAACRPLRGPPFPSPTQS
jgi:hypothetical protein